MEGPGISRQRVPLDVFISSSGVPKPTVSIAEVPVSNALVLIADISSFRQTAQVHKVVFKEGPLLWAEVAKSPFRAKVVMPVGRHSLNATVHYGDGHFSDGAPIEFEIKPPDIAPWELSRIDDTERSYGAHLDDKGESLTLLGDGLLFATQSVHGDFVLTAQVPFIGNATGRPANPLGHSAGLMIRSTRTCKSWAFNSFNATGSYSFIEYDMYYKGHLFSSTEPDVTGGKLWNEAAFPLVIGQWMRLSRIGNDLSFFSSPDGKEWKFIRTIHDDKMPVDAYVGPFLYKLPNPTIFSLRADFEHLKLESVK